MRFLEHFLATLLSFILGTFIVITIFGLTLGQASFWTSALEKSGLYNSLASLAPGASSQTMRSVVEPLIPQLIAHYSAGGPAPTLDLAPLLPTEAKALYPDPIPLTAGPSDAIVTQAVGIGQSAQLWAGVAVAVLVALIAATMGARRLPTLIRATIWTTITCVVGGVIFLLLPTIGGFFLNGPQVAPLRPALLKLLQILGAAIGTDLLLTAAGLFAVVVILTIIDRFLRLRAKFARPPKLPQPQSSPPSSAKI